MKFVALIRVLSDTFEATLHETYFLTLAQYFALVTMLKFLNLSKV